MQATQYAFLGLFASATMCPAYREALWHRECFVCDKSRRSAEGLAPKYREYELRPRVLTPEILSAETGCRVRRSSQWHCGGIHPLSVVAGACNCNHVAQLSLGLCQLHPHDKRATVRRIQGWYDMADFHDRCQIIRLLLILLERGRMQTFLAPSWKPSCCLLCPWPVVDRRRDRGFSAAQLKWPHCHGEGK